VAKQFTVEPLHRPLLYYMVHDASLTGQIGNRALRRMTADYLLEASYLDRKKYRKRLAAIEAMEAFECYKGKDYFKVLKYVWLAIWQDTSRVKNIGMLKLIGRSITAGLRQKFFGWLRLVRSRVSSGGTSKTL
jgi:hypothetical protein